MRYDAFISYSHAADSQLAPRLQDGMQRMARPWWRRRALHVFRDNTGLTANPGLWTSIATAMDEAEWFVFLASPEAAASPWVQREIAHWLEHRDVDHILPVVTDGEWVWNDETNDFDRARSTAVPPALFGAFKEEPRHIDMRWAHTEEQVDLRHPGFRDDVAAVAAPIHGLAKDELVGEDVRQHRRTMRYAWGAAAALVLLTLGSVIAGVLAVRNADAAESAKNEANANAIAADQQKAIADANAEEAAANAREALANSQRAEANAAEAMSQTELAEQNAAEASQQRSAAESSALEAQVQAAEAARQARAAIDARDAESAAKADAELQAQNALRAQAEAVTEKENAQRQEQIANEQRAVAEDQRRAAEAAAVAAAEAAAAEAAAAQRAAEAQVAAETTALAAQSAAQLDEDAALSLLLAIEANDHGVPSSEALAATGSSPQAVSGSSPVGRRALFEAVTRARGGAKQVPVDRFLPLPPDTEDPPSYLWRPAISPNGRWLAAAESTDPSDDVTKPFPARVFVWDLENPGSTVKVLRGHQHFIFLLAFAGDDTLVTMDSTNDFLADPPTTIVWDVQAGTAALSRHATPHIAPGGKVIALQSALTLDVDFVDAATRTVTARQDGLLTSDLQSTPGPVSPSTFGWLEKPFSRDGRFARGESNGVAVLWDLETGGRRVIPLIPPDGFFSDTPSVDPTGTLATAIVDGWQLVFFRTSDGAEVDRWFIADFTEIVLNTVWSPDGSRFALLVWDFATNTEHVIVAVSGEGSWSASMPGCGELVGTATPCRIGFTGRGNHLTVEIPREGHAIDTFVLDSATSALLGVIDGEVITDARDDGSLLYVQRLQAETRIPTLTIEDLHAGRTLLAEASATTVDAVNRTLLAVTTDRAGERLAVSTADGEVRIWDLTGSAPAVSAAGPSRLYLGLAFDEHAPVLVGVGIGATTTRWDHSAPGSADRIGTTDPSAAILADGRTVAEPAEGRDAVVLRDLVTDQTRPGPSLDEGDVVQNVVAGGNGPLAVNLEDGSAVVGDLDGNALGRVDGPVRAASHDGSRFAVRKPDRRIDVVDTAGLRVVRTIDLAPLADPGLPGTPVGDIEDVLALDPSGTRLAATNATGQVVVWDVRSGNVVADFDGTPIDRNAVPFAGVAFSPTGDRLVAKSPSNLVRMWDTGNWSQLANEQLQNDEFAGRVAFSPDGTLVAVDGLFVLDGSTLELVADLAFETTSGMRFSADGRSLLVLRDDGAILRWAVGVDELEDMACSLAGRNLTRNEWARYLPNVGYRATCPNLPIEP
jgi:WD40 repeat protein